MARKKHISDSLFFHRDVMMLMRNLKAKDAYELAEQLHLRKTGSRMYSNYSSFATSRTYLLRKYRPFFKKTNEINS